jgi:hypothetical protein
VPLLRPLPLADLPGSGGLCAGYPVVQLKPHRHTQSEMLVSCIVCLVLCFENCEAKFAGRGCAASDTNLLLRKQTICASIGGCAAGNVTAEGDWPNQAIYMNNLLAALVAPTTCLNTSVAKDVVTWLDVTNTTTPWWNTWVIFQVSDQWPVDDTYLSHEIMRAPHTLSRCSIMTCRANLDRASNPLLR